MFRLMTPPGSDRGEHRLEGAIGGTPDVDLIHVGERCCRFTLPPFLDNLVFNFGETLGFVRVENFYHVGDFFVVSNTLKMFLEAHAGCGFEVKAIRTKHPHDEKTEQFWAMKVATRVDCILPDQSFANKRFWLNLPAQSFRDLAFEFRLSAEISPYFANKGSDTYYSYPSMGVRAVSMDFSSVPRGVKLFEPLYWPQFLVVDSSFADELEKQCNGRTFGYYFWTLGFDDVANEYHKLLMQHVH